MLTTLIWGATFPATKAVLTQIAPIPFLFLRFVLGLVLVAGVLMLSGRRVRSDASVLKLAAVATIFLYLGYVLQTVGIRYTSASNSAFITALYVVFVPLFLRRFGARIWLSALLAIAGLWLLVNPTVKLNLGDVLTLGCAMAFAAHIISLEAFIPRTEPASLFIWQLVFVTLALGPTMLLEPPDASQLAPTSVLLIGLTITGGLATGAFAVQMWAQQLLPAQRVALIFSLEPAFAAWLSWVTLDEHLDAMAWVGSALILCGVIVGATQATERDVIARGVAEHG
ncbi:MAG TPA: DMT family transporter [Nitrospirales bacterium]|nr:DMT family transporter [Nitrospirales bacterium]